MSFIKKLLIVILSVVCVTACAFFVTACNPKPDDSTNVEQPENPEEKPEEKPGDKPGEGENPEEKPEEKPEETPEHTFAEGWTGDSDYHWHVATDGSGEISGKALHNWVIDSQSSVKATCSSAGKQVYKCSDCGETKTETLAQLTHVWSESTQTVSPTCTVSGYEYKTCTNDGCTATTTVRYLEALGHDYDEATCTSASVCKREGCGITVAPALTHDYQVAYKIDADCTHEEVTYYECSHCHDEFDTVTAPALGHIVIWNEDGNESHEHVGSEHVCYTITYHGYCAECDAHEGAEFVKTIEVSAHKFTSSITTLAKCNAPGVKTFTCSDCGYSYTESYTDENAHIWDDGTTAGNITTYTCTNDHSHTKQAVVYVETQAVVPVEDLKTAGSVTLDTTSIALDDGVKNTISGNESVTLSADVLDENSLTELDKNIGSGVQVYNLTLEIGGQPVSELGGTVTVTVPYILGEGEDPDNIVVLYVNGNDIETVTGTYSNGNVIFQTTHFSYYTVSRMTPAERCEIYGHAEKVIKVDATCLLSGYEMTICTRCGEVLEKTDIPALGHEWHTSGTQATCTENGNITYTCVNCDFSYKVTVPATGHNWVATESVSATCEHAGHAHYVCLNCDDEYDTTEAQKNHSFKVTVVPATCTESGYTLSVCIVCGHENITDYVEATGHITATKVVAPTCTLQGYTLTYCTVCGEELGKSNITEPTGHNMVNGVCTVCGEGCNHKYTAGEHVHATCTEQGYTLYTCSICGASYKDDIENALGHDYDIDECVRCHEANPNAINYYLNLVNTSIEGSVAIKVSGFKMNMVNDYVNFESGSTFTVTYKAEQLTVANIVLSLSANGTVIGSGEGTIKIEVDGESCTFDCKFAITDGNVYAIIDTDNQALMPSMKVIIDFDYMFSNITAGALTYDTVREYLVWYNTSAKTVIDSILNSNSEMTAQLIKLGLNNLFTRESIADGYKYTINLDVAEKLNEALNTVTVSTLADKILGNGAYRQLPSAVNSFLSLTPDEALALLADYGFNRTQVCSAVDSFMYIMTGQKFNSSEMLDAIIESEGEDITVADAIMRYMQMEGTRAEFVSSINEMVTAKLDAYKDMSVYEVLADVKGMSAESIYEMISDMIEAYKPVAEESAQFCFTTDKSGNITSISLSADVEELPIIIGSGENYSESLTVNVKGSFEFIFGAETVVDEDIVKEVLASKLVLEANEMYTAYSYTESRFDEDNKDFVNYRSVREMLIYTDIKGNIAKIVVTEESVNRFINNTFGNYYYVEENYYTMVNEYDLTGSANFTMISDNYCGDINFYLMQGDCKFTYETTSYSKTYHRTTGAVIRNILNYKDSEENEYYSSVQFYYDTQEKEFLNKDPHSTDNLKFVESESDISCGGYYYYECEDCGYVYKSYIYHLGNDVITYELAPGATSCEDGVYIKYTCSECGEVKTTHLYTHSHDMYVKEVIDCTEYGSECDHAIYIYGCACGAYEGSYITLHKFGEDEDEVEEVNRSIKSLGEFDYNGITVNVYQCVVTDCGFAFAIYTEEEKGADCLTETYEHIILGVTVDMDNGTVSGGTEYRTLYNGKSYNHTYTHVHQGDAHNFIDKDVCEDCGFVKYINEYSSEYQNGLIMSESSTNIQYSEVNGSVLFRDVTNATYEYNGANVVLKTSETFRYVGENVEFKSVAVVTYNYNLDGTLDETLETISNYSEDIDRVSYVYERGLKYLYFEGVPFEVTSLTSETYYSYEGDIQRLSKLVYDYSDPCHPTVTEYSIYGSYTRNLEAVHYCAGEYVTQPTCTQQGTKICLHCGEEVLYGNPHGHEYSNGVCIYCGLETTNGDGRVLFEDMSYTSEGNYVIGYYNREASTDYYNFEFYLIDGDNNEHYLEDFYYDDTRRNAETYFGSGKVIFSVSSIKNEAQKLGLNDYMIRVTFVSEYFAGELDYSITIDAHEWQDGTLTYTVDNEQGDPQVVNEDVKFCASCGLVMNYGYLKLQEITDEDGNVTGYTGQNYRYEEFTISLATQPND